MLNLLLFNFNVLAKKPYAVFSLFFPRKINAFLSSKHKLLYRWVGWLIKEKPEEIKESHFSSSTFKVGLQSRFYKIGLWQGGFKAEYKNHINIKENYAALSIFLPSLQLYHRFLFGYFKMTSYSLPDREKSILLALRILNALRQYGKKETQPISFFRNIQHGIYLSQLLYGKKYGNGLLKQVVNILSLPWILGPWHGDFHTGNMLKNTNEMPILIDLDSFSEKGIQALDAFTFLVDSITRESKKNWQSVINKLISCEDKEEKYLPLYAFFDHDLKKVALLYILNRLGHENRIYFFLSRSVKREYALLKDWTK